MMFSFSMRASLAACALLMFSSSTVHAHTWVEQLQKIAPNGTFVGDTGYIRGFGPRLPQVNVDLINTYKLLTFSPTDSICKDTQQIGMQASGYPPLKAAPKDQVALSYKENGHVTKFGTNLGKPLGRGTVFIYGTTTPSASDTYLNVHRQWNAAGTGGNGKGKLLATRPFDDGRCFQVSGTDTMKQRAAAINAPTPLQEVNCQADFQIPADAPTTGTYTVYWVWEWPTLYSNGAIQSNESYTSCMDITMQADPVPGSGPFNTAQVSGNTAQSAAISSYLTTQFIVDPTSQPQVAPDNVNPVAAPPGVQAPAAATPPAASSAAASPPAASPAAAQSSSPAIGNNGGKMVTVTVTESSVVTVTQMIPIASGSVSAHTSSSQTPVGAPASNPSSIATVAAAGKPAVTPFLAPSKRSVSVRGRAVLV